MEDLILSAFVKMFGDQVSKDNVMTRHKIGEQSLYAYMKRGIDPHPTYLKRGHFKLMESEEWFKRNGLGAYRSR